MTETATTTLVTGGNSGIGEAVARRLIDKGERVVSLGLDLPSWTHERLFGFRADLTDIAETRDVAAKIASEFEIDGIVNNAGLILPNLLPDARAEDIQTLSQLHLGAPLILMQAVLPGMEQRNFGRIVFVSSRASMGARTRSAYAATKAGIHGLARTWALELARNGITVNVVAPGPVLTDNFWGIVPKDSELQEKMANAVPMGRIGTREDVANAVTFFLDRQASFITGQVLFVCGGTSLGGMPA